VTEGGGTLPKVPYGEEKACDVLHIDIPKGDCEKRIAHMKTAIPGKVHPITEVLI